MTSIHQLTAGYKGSLSSIKASWLKFNNNSGHAVQVSQNIAKPKARYLSVCYSSSKTGWDKADGCQAHLRAIGDSRNDMTVVSCDLVHTCDVSKVHRKRNYRRKDISEVSNVLEYYRPTGNKEGNTKQFVQMTKTATGMTVKTGQANLAIRSKCNDSIEVQIGQYMWLPSLFCAYQEDRVIQLHP